MWTVLYILCRKLPCLLLDVFFYLAFHSRLTFPEYLLTVVINHCKIKKLSIRDNIANRIEFWTCDYNLYINMKCLLLGFCVLRVLFLKMRLWILLLFLTNLVCKWSKIYKWNKPKAICYILILFHDNKPNWSKGLRPTLLSSIFKNRGRPHVGMVSSTHTQHT